jgi:hypothetical protein
VLSVYEDFSYEKLNKNCSYTIGFSHSDFHPFQGTVNPTRKPFVEAWFIQSSNLTKFNNGKPFIKFNENIGLPLQKSIKVDDIKKLCVSATNAYQNYINTGETNYGYLLLYKHRYYLIESTLMESIRILFYLDKFNKLDTGIDKRKYIIVNSFLSANKYEMFLKIAPIYKSEFTFLNSEVAKIIDLLVKITFNKNFIPQTLYETVINEFHKYITQSITLDTRKVESVKSIICTFLYDQKNTNMVYRLTYGQIKQ